MKNSLKTISADEQRDLLATLKARFEKNMARHQSMEWQAIQLKLEKYPTKLWSLHEMEITGGEPDVIHYDAESDTYTFVDCAAESPKGRRSTCYDQDALDSRKEFKPENSVLEMAAAMEITLLTEKQYRQLQELGKFDLKTSSWVATPDEIRELGGALFCDRRYNTVFTYHNGASSYYAARGFRGCLVV
ncbi:MAG: DUF4256 domain-containing protein [Pedobacter sp.]|nr:MAG: DUF4256 domain-containing protein [Pedobacter sp.]